MEQLEELCDDVANAVDAAGGTMDNATVDALIVKALDGTEFSDRQFNEMFGNLYECSPHRYVKNAAEDSDWANHEVAVLESLDDDPCGSEDLSVLSEYDL